MAKENLIKERESKTDIAYRLMSKRKKERSFYDLWEDVKAELVKLYGEEAIENIDEDISFFYTNLTLDGRFVNVGDNKWNLRERVTFDKVHIDMNDIYVEDEEDISEDNEDSKDEYVADDYEDSYDDSTGSDADINQYRDQKVVDEDEVDTDKIGVGCKVTVLDVEFDEELEYKIVGSTEANSLQGKISNESPVGHALMGRMVGDVVDVETQAGTFQYKVLTIERSN